MKVFNFCDYEGVNTYSYSDPIIEKKFVIDYIAQTFIIDKISKASSYVYVEHEYYAIDSENMLHVWDSEGGRYINTSILKPEKSVFYGLSNGYCLFTKGTLKKELSLIDIEKKEEVYNLSFRGLCLYFDGMSYALYYSKEKEIKGYNIETQEMWSFSGDFSIPRSIRELRVSFLTNGKELEILDLGSGIVTFRQACSGSILELKRFDNEIYIFFSDRLWVYDYDKNVIDRDMALPIDRSICIYKPYLFVAGRDDRKITCYDLYSFDLVANQSIDRGYFPTGGNFIINNDIGVISLGNREDILNQVGKSYTAIFSLDEFFSDNFQQEIEPDYFEVHEEADIEGGNNLRITLDTSINFDTLYRHLSVALQNIPFRHGNYGWAATLDEEKPVNENFNGKVIADLSDHAFTSEQRDLLEGVIQEAMEFYANRQITSGDGKGTPCYVVSVIPVAE